MCRLFFGKHHHRAACHAAKHGFGHPFMRKMGGFPFADGNPFAGGNPFQGKNPFMNSFNPVPINILEKETEFVIELLVPGFQKGDFKIGVSEDTLTVSVDEKQNTENQTYTRRDFPVNSFRRSFDLAGKVLIQEITASYEEGILRITLPKTLEAQQSKTEIRVG